VTGIELLRLVRDRTISDVEAHLDAAYALHAGELSSLFQGVVGALLGTVGALGIAMAQDDDLAAHTLGLVLLSILFTAPVCLACVITFARLRRLRRELGAAKDLAGRFAEIYRGA
jgi:hypothetical protein